MLAVGLVAAVVAGTLGNKGRPSSTVSLVHGVLRGSRRPIWARFALIDGTTVTRVAEVPVSRAGDDQAGGTGGIRRLLVDHSLGQAVPVDGSSLSRRAGRSS